MVERGLITATGPGADRLLKRWTDVLPGCLNAHEACWLRLIEAEDYKNLANGEYDAARLAAAAAKHAGQIKKERRVRDLPRTPVPTERALAYRKEIEDVTASMEEQSRLGVLPPIPADALADSRRLGLEFLARMEEIGPQAALIERLPVAGLARDHVLKLTTEEHVERHCFQVLVRSFARDVLKATEDQQDFLAQTLALADCPGSWLQRRLEACVRRGCSEPRPNHRHDAERLAYLPYVDVLLTDAEMAEFVRQIRRDESTPEAIRNARAPVAVPNSLDALEEVIGSTGGLTGHE